MASYLLKATDEEMARWKANAAGLGITFAQYVRAQLDASPDMPSFVFNSAGGLDVTTTGGGTAPTAVKPRKARKRTELCIHRRPPDQFCSRCDG